MLFVYLSKGYQPVPEKKSPRPGMTFAWRDFCEPLRRQHLGFGLNMGVDLV